MTRSRSTCVTARCFSRSRAGLRAFWGETWGGVRSKPIAIGYLLSALNLPTYLSVKVTDPDRAEKVLPQVFQSLMYEQNSREFSSESYSLEPYRGKTISVFSFSLLIARIRLYAAVINDQLVIASRRDIITDLIDQASLMPAKAAGNFEFSLYRTAFREIEPAVSLGYQEDIRRACHKNLALVETLLDTARITPDDIKAAAFALRGYEPYCPAGGRYYLDPETGRATCWLHGRIHRPIQPVKAAEGSSTMRLVNNLKKINARLAFTPEGLMATVDLQRAAAQ